MKYLALFALPILVLACVPRPYSDFQRAIDDGATEEDLRALDGAGKEGGLLLIALLDTDLKWSLRTLQGSPIRGPEDLQILVESVGNYQPGLVPGFERFTTGYKPPRKVHVVLRNPLAVLWAMERDEELRKAK